MKVKVRKSRSLVGLPGGPPPLRMKAPPFAKVSVTVEHQKIIDKWNNYGFKKFYIRDTKVFTTTIRNLRKLKSGRLFNGDIKLVAYKRKYTHEEILHTIDNLALAINDYEQFNLELRDIKRLSNCTLGEFIYNPWNPYKSEFVKFLDERLIDKHKNITKLLKRFYINKVLGGIKPARGFSWYENSKFIESGIKIDDFYTRNKRLMRNSVSSNIREFTNLVCEAIADDINEITQLTPGYFCSELTFNRRIPAYLNKQGVLMVKEETEEEEAKRRFHI